MDCGSYQPLYAHKRTAGSSMGCGRHPAGHVWCRADPFPPQRRRCAGSHCGQHVMTRSITCTRTDPLGGSAQAPKQHQCMRTQWCPHHVPAMAAAAHLHAWRHMCSFPSAAEVGGVGPSLCASPGDSGEAGPKLLTQPPDASHHPHRACCCPPAGPDLAQLREIAGLMQPELIRSVPTEFDPRYANPCWTEEDNRTTHCLPGFYILGDAYSGAGQLWSLLGQHPEVPKVGEVQGAAAPLLAATTCRHQQRQLLPLPLIKRACHASTRARVIAGHASSAGRPCSSCASSMASGT